MERTIQRTSVFYPNCCCRQSHLVKITAHKSLHQHFIICDTFSWQKHFITFNSWLVLFAIILNICMKKLVINFILLFSMVYCDIANKKYIFSSVYIRSLTLAIQQLLKIFKYTKSTKMSTVKFFLPYVTCCYCYWPFYQGAPKRWPVLPPMKGQTI